MKMSNTQELLTMDDNENFTAFQCTVSDSVMEEVK